VERAFPIRLYDGTTAPPIREPKVTARLKKREPLSADDFSALKTMTRGPIKANLPTPSVAHFFTGDAVLDRRAYGNREEFMDDLARIMREEIADLSARGCTYLQMDEVPLAVICDPKNMEVVRARGDDPGELIDLYIDAINDSIIDRPANMTVCVHMCRGNCAQGMADGGYEPIARSGCSTDSMWTAIFSSMTLYEQVTSAHFGICPSRRKLCSGSFPQSFRKSKRWTL
jgi:5-methyltetrahydropteroyltriglutamate--homocysteine methyltransferase